MLFRLVERKPVWRNSYFQLAMMDPKYLHQQYHFTITLLSHRNANFFPKGQANKNLLQFSKVQLPIYVDTGKVAEPECIASCSEKCCEEYYSIEWSVRPTDVDMGISRERVLWAFSEK